MGKRAESDWLRRYGNPGPHLAKLADPPPWFSSELREIWIETIAAAPPGLLAEIDRDLFVSHAIAIDVHRRLAQRHSEGSFGSEFEKRLREAAAELRRTAQALSLRPYDRLRVSLPAEKEPAAGNDVWGQLRRFPTVSNPHARFDVILPSGKRISGEKLAPQGKAPVSPPRGGRRPADGQS
jgi:hypothetical protein